MTDPQNLSTDHQLRLLVGPGEELVVPPGTPLYFEEGKAFLRLATGPRAISCRAATKALGLKRPSTEQLIEWEHDGWCESMLGERVEPDGVDERGSPSWMLALELI